jgi:hypothetical protein
MDETGLLSPVFPTTCPFTSEEILDDNFFPNA